MLTELVDKSALGGIRSDRKQGEKSGLTRGWSVFVSEKILTPLCVDYICMYVDLYTNYCLSYFYLKINAQHRGEKVNEIIVSCCQSRYPVIRRS